MGRKISHHKEDHEEAIIGWISEGKTLRDYCRQDDCPSFHTVYRWLDDDNDFSRRFARAREIGHDVIAQECLSIANTPVAEEELQIDSEGKTKKTIKDALGHRKLQIDTRLKLLAKWDPKRYGDKLELGSDPDKPIVTEIRRRIIKPDDNS
jgi:hypothetical protein